MQEVSGVKSEPVHFCGGCMFCICRFLESFANHHMQHALLDNTLLYIFFVSLLLSCLDSSEEVRGQKVAWKFYSVSALKLLTDYVANTNRNY